MEKLEKLNQEEYQEKEFFVSNNFGKILKLNKSGYILNRAELETISRTPKKECFICDAIVNNCLGLEPEKFYLLPEDILDAGFEEHLKQIFSKLYYFDRENMGDSMLEDSDTKKVLLKSIELMDEQQKVELYEHFHGGTFSTSQFYDWIEKDLS